MWIDLGNVKNLAAAAVNGKDAGKTWHAPYCADATSARKPGANQITIKVMNVRVNRLTGDQRPHATEYTLAEVKPYRANSPLLPPSLFQTLQCL